MFSLWNMDDDWYLELATACKQNTSLNFIWCFTDTSFLNRQCYMEEFPWKLIPPTFQSTFDKLDYFWDTLRLLFQLIIDIPIIVSIFLLIHYMYTINYLKNTFNHYITFLVYHLSVMWIFWKCKINLVILCEEKFTHAWR